MSSCPASCANLAAPSECDVTSCVEGCQCAAGFVMSEGTCVPYAQCGCTFLNRYYPVSGLTRVTVYLCDHAAMCAHISPSCSSKRSLWPRTALSLVSVAVPVPCASRRPARTLTCAPSTTSNVTATKVRVHASVWAPCILIYTIIQQGCVGESACWTGLCAVRTDNMKAKIQQI